MGKAIHVLILVVLIVFVSCNNTQNTQTNNLQKFENSDALVEAAKEVITEITIDEFKKLYDSDEYFVLIDVREVEEYDAGYISGAVSISRGVLEFKIGKEEVWDEMGLYIPEKTDQIVLNCRTGGRSALAAKSLLELGYENVKSLQGGFNAWNEAHPDYVEKIFSEEAGYEEMPTQSRAAGGC